LNGGLRTGLIFAWWGALISGCSVAVPAPPGDYSHWNWPVTQRTTGGLCVWRSYWVHVPPAAEAADPLPLVLNFHPAFNNGLLQSLYSGMNRKADAEGFVVVYPDSLGFLWNVGEADARWGLMRLKADVDVEFVRILLDTLHQKLRIDPTRVYATGFSSGAAMSVRLACASAKGQLGVHKIAAIAPVSGGPMPESGDFQEAYQCAALREDPVPMRMIVSNHDKTLAWLLEVSVEDASKRLRELATDYALANGCAEASTRRTTGRTGWGVLAETIVFSSEDRRRETILDVFGTGGQSHDGHVWPGPWFGGELKATDVVWSFFRAHRRPE
jgi:polyhydroxybutyrate depolymerase